MEWWGKVGVVGEGRVRTCLVVGKGGLSTVWPGLERDVTEIDSSLAAEQFARLLLPSSANRQRAKCYENKLCNCLSNCVILLKLMGVV